MSVNPSLIVKDYDRNSLLNENSILTLRDGYLQEGEDPQDAFARASAAFADNLEHAQRIYDYVSKLWFMFSTPVLANAGSKTNLPISCFGGSVPDSLVGITEHWKEQTFLTAKGGGTSGYWGNLRTEGVQTSGGSQSGGMIPFLKVIDSIMLAAKQGKVRRGAYAAYLDVSHPEIEEFLDVRDPSGDHNRRCLGTGFHHAVNVPDSFMIAVEKDLDWNLIDPHTKEVVKTIKARALWQKIILMRLKTGEPYIHFIDTSNRYLPSNLKRKGLLVNNTNLCTEIFLPNGIDYDGKMRTFVCCLSSLNLDKWDEYEDKVEQVVGDLIRMLDNVLQTFIDNAPPELESAKYAATMTRDLGLGAMGFHSYLQKKRIPFESSAASEVNNRIFYLIEKAATKASKELAEEKGAYPDSYVDGINVHRSRNAHKLAIAPNASSSIICGNVSPSVEPIPSNYLVQRTKVGVLGHKNPYLVEYLESIGKNTEEVWKSIMAHEGSIQHLDFFTENDKLVFKTAFEIDQSWVIEHAALRQAYICQGQSINLFVPLNMHAKEINKLHMSAWTKGLKALYYVRSRAVKSGENIAIAKSRETVDPDMVGCKSCEG